MGFYLARNQILENDHLLTMFNAFEPNVKATIAFLKLLNVKVNRVTVNESLQNHPDWPGLLCVSDSLNKWHIQNAVCKIEKRDIEQLPLPFIAYMNDRQSPLTIVTQVTPTHITSYKDNYSKFKTEAWEDFFERWNGISLIAEPTESSGEPNYEKTKRKAFLSFVISLAAFATVLVASFLLLNKIIGASGTFASLSKTGIYLQYLVLMAGVVVTSLLLWYEMDNNNPMLQKFCTGIAKANCNAILTGKQSKVFEWLSWSEVGFFYFAGGLLTLLFAENAVAVLGWINMLALPYTVFSVYYQSQVAKQWCVFCLAVQLLLIIGAANSIISGFLNKLPPLSLFIVAQTVFLYFLPLVIWYALKPYLLKLQVAKNMKREYLHIKFNTEIFDTLLKKQKRLIPPADGLGIILGNPAASNELIKVCNPYCGPCAKAHPEMENLLEQNKNIKARIIFTATTDSNDRAALPVRHLLAIADSNNEMVTKKALDDWYLANKKNYDVFALKYPMNGELKEQDEKIDSMNKWCKAAGIQFTPTIFINGYEMPDAYSIQDLEYFLSE